MTQLSSARPYRQESPMMSDEPFAFFLIDQHTYREIQHQHELDSLLRSILFPISMNVVLTKVEIERAPGMSVVLELEKELTGLRELYILRNDVIVEDYLKRNYKLTRTLFEAYLEINKRFGFDSRICLEVITDPETPKFKQLVAFIRTKMNAEDAFDALTSLEEEWWLMHPSFETGSLCFHVECI